MSAKPGFFICGHCGKEEPLSEEGIAIEEMQKNFGPDCKKEDCGIICDECYERFMIWKTGDSKN